MTDRGPKEIDEQLVAAKAHAGDQLPPRSHISSYRRGYATAVADTIEWLAGEREAPPMAWLNEKK